MLTPVFEGMLDFKKSNANAEQYINMENKLFSI